VDTVYVVITCPACGTWTRILETRTRVKNVVRRRYECANEHRFSTIETVEDKPVKEKGKQWTQKQTTSKIVDEEYKQRRMRPIVERQK